MREVEREGAKGREKGLEEDLERDKAWIGALEQKWGYDSNSWRFEVRGTVFYHNL